jgi:hypothetical protein
MHCSKRKASQVVKATRDPNSRERQHIQRSQTEQAAPNEVTSERRERLTIKHRADRPPRVDRNHKLSARPALPHIRGVMQKVLESVRQEHRLPTLARSWDSGLKGNWVTAPQKVKIEMIKIALMF